MPEKPKKELVVADMPVPTRDTPFHLFEVKMVVVARSGAGVSAVLEHVQLAVAATGLGVVLDKGNAIKAITKGGGAGSRMVCTGFDQYKIKPKDTTLKVLKIAEGKEAMPAAKKEKPVKLTKPQEELLRLAAEPKGTYAVSYYPPCKKLHELGFIDNGGKSTANNDHHRWEATEKGKAWLAERPAGP